MIQKASKKIEETEQMLQQQQAFMGDGLKAKLDDTICKVRELESANVQLKKY